MMHQLFGRAAAGALLSASFLFAQATAVAPTTAPTPPTAAQLVTGRIARLTTLLTLTTAQQSQATTIFTTAQNTFSGLATALNAALTALQNAVLSNDTNAVATQAAQLGSLTTQRVEAEATAEAAFYLILTADQQTKYKTILTQDPGLLGGPGGPGGGHGGPGGPGRH